MLCPSCKSNNSKVVDSRLTEGDLAIRRRRECIECSRRFTTKERVEEALRLTVVKSNGQRVPYDREKVLTGVERACYKLDVSEGELQQLVDRVEEELFTNHDRDVDTETIGRYVGNYLRGVNTVAYVRFMSVHRKYGTIDEFIDEIRDVRERVARDNPQQQNLFGN